MRLSTGSTGGGFGGTRVGIEIPEVGEGREAGDENVLRLELALVFPEEEGVMQHSSVSISLSF